MKRTSKQKRVRRHFHIRKRIEGTTARPRLCVFRSIKHIYAQVVDDTEGKTLASASTLDKDLKGKVGYTGNVSAAKAVGQLVAERAKAKGIELVVFDRGGFLYHGRVSALADGAREGGLKF